MRGENGTVESVIDSGADINAFDNGGYTPLMRAARNGHISTLTLLLDRGADIDIADLESNTALIRAIKNARIEIATLLLDRGAKIDIAEKNAFVIAAQEGNLQIVQMLIDRGAEVDTPDKRGYTALLRAARHGHAKVATLLLELGANTDYARKDGFTPLIWAVQQSNSQMVNLILNKGITEDIADKDGYTALIWAVQQGNADMVMLLLDYGVQRDIADKVSYYDCVGHVVDDKDDDDQGEIGKKDAKNKSGFFKMGGYTALIWATWYGHAGIVRLLLDRGAKIDIADKGGYTAFMWATWHGHVGIATLLLDRGARIDIADKGGFSALMWATRQGDSGIVRLLLDRGAKIDIADKGGYTDQDCSRLVQISQSLKVSSTDSTPAHKLADQPKAILAAAEQAKAIQKAADKARQEAAAAERLRVEELKAEQAAADQLKADQVIAAAVVAAETAQFTALVLESFVSDTTVPVPYSLVSVLASGFRNEIYKGSLCSVYSGWVVPQEVSVDRVGEGEGRRVAVKTINTEYMGGNEEPLPLEQIERIEAVAQSMRREVDMLSAVHHVNVIRLVGYCLPSLTLGEVQVQAMKELCLVYELAPLGSLNTILEDSTEAAKLKWLNRLNIAIGVAKGMCYLHSSAADRPVYHRDIKSSNIALMSDYTPKLIGFGLSEYMSVPALEGVSTHSRSRSNASQNTLTYTCPDYKSNEGMVYDAKCDIFSFGIVLLELLTGEMQAFLNKDKVEILLEVFLKERGAVSADSRVQWPAAVVDDILSLARECVAPHQTRISSMLAVLQRLEAMSNKHYTPSTTEIDLLQQKELLLARLAALELLVEVKAMQAVEVTYTCMSCFDDCIPASKGAVCSNGTFPHFFCGAEINNCLGNMLSSQSNDAATFAKNSCDIVCACCTALVPRVVSTFDVSVIARLSNKEALTSYISAVTDVERQQGVLATEKLRSQYVVEIQMLNETCAKDRADRLKAKTERHRLHIINNIMTLLCPHCKMAIFDFVNCFAVKHESDTDDLKYGCGLYFCGWCLAKCANSSDCHTHVRVCKHSLRLGNVYGNFPVDFDKAHAKRRKELVLVYLRDNIVDTRERKEVHKALWNELKNLGVDIGPSP